MPLKPWPRDVVVIACEWPSWADRQAMDWPLRMECRDCGRNVLVDLRSIQTAWDHPQRFGRWLALLCPRCAGEYDSREVKHLARPGE